MCRPDERTGHQDDRLDGGITLSHWRTLEHVWPTQKQDSVWFSVVQCSGRRLGANDFELHDEELSSSKNRNRERRVVMPLINIKVIEGVFSPEQKAQIVRKLTDAMVEVEGEAMRPVTWAVIEEVRSGDWAIGGKALSTADVKALGAARPARVG